MSYLLSIINESQKKPEADGGYAARLFELFTVSMVSPPSYPPPILLDDSDPPGEL